MEKKQTIMTKFIFIQTSRSLFQEDGVLKWSRRSGHILGANPECSQLHQGSERGHKSVLTLNGVVGETPSLESRLTNERRDDGIGRSTSRELGEGRGKFMVMETGLLPQEGESRLSSSKKEGKRGKKNKAKLFKVAVTRGHTAESDVGPKFMARISPRKLSSGWLRVGFG